MSIWKLRHLRLAYLIFFLGSSAFADSTLTIIDQYYQAVDEPEALLFTPPQGWRTADPEILPSRVKWMVIGTGSSDYPPSINLGVEPFQGTLKEYLRIVKTINLSHGSAWKDLGKIQTEAGPASFSQVDMTTKWGEVRLMHVILLKSDTIYILTAAARKDEFSTFYPVFFKAMKSIRFNPSALQMVESPKRRAELKRAIQQVKSRLKFARKNGQEFSDEAFQNSAWIPFQEKLEHEYNDMGLKWKKHLLNKTRTELFKNL